jgi:hypothetical protein
VWAHRFDCTTPPGVISARRPGAPVASRKPMLSPSSARPGRTMGGRWRPPAGRSAACSWATHVRRGAARCHLHLAECPGRLPEREGAALYRSGDGRLGGRVAPLTGTSRQPTPARPYTLDRGVAAPKSPPARADQGQAGEDGAQAAGVLFAGNHGLSWWLVVGS